MEITSTTPEPGTLSRDGVEWHRLQGAMRHLESAQTTPRVLIVDDDPATRLLYALNLELEGLVVLEAADGRSGLERARSELPDLVLTDVMMPGFDGFELAEALRRDEATRLIPFIFLSGETTAGIEARAHELGALAYLIKPVDLRALGALVAGVFAGSSPSKRTPAFLVDESIAASDSAA